MGHQAELASPDALEEESRSFPDCWLAYGASDAELGACGPVWQLGPGNLKAVIAAQVALGVVLLAVVGLTVGAARWAAAASLLAVLGSLLVNVLRATGLIRRAEAYPEGLRLIPAVGATAIVPWPAVAEIALVQSRRWQGVGLRLRATGRAVRPRPVAHLRRLVSSGFDALAIPADGDPALLARVLLRYCIDPTARRRLPALGE